MPISNRLAPAGEVGLDTNTRPAAITRKAQDGAHIIHNQQRAGLVAQLACPACIGRINIFLVHKCVVLDG